MIEFLQIRFTKNVTWCFRAGSIRHFSKKSGPSKSKKYSQTLNLPVTKFPTWVKTEDRVQIDQLIHKTCGFSELYAIQRGFKSRPEFILHDGPPYANGDVHMGHAINKILKDIINRRKLLEGYRIHYVPGWDCHGLPIELKAVKHSAQSSLSALEIRNIARIFAEETIVKQKKCFESWGVMANWDSECYFTFDKKYTQNQLQLFYSLYEKGLIYRGLKPVYWSPSSRTALAEAELEYNNAHQSCSVFLRLRLCTLPDTIKLHVGSKTPYAVIWTTTPWTLPCNKAVAFNPSLEYSLISFLGEASNVYLVATALINKLEEKLKKSSETVAQFPGAFLNGLMYQHPLNSSLAQPFIEAKHVLSDKGTGLVHTAPAHGPEDFLLAVQHRISIDSMVDEAGLYTANAGNDLEGLSVLSDGVEKVKQILGSDIMLEETFVHSYPYDWRTKEPVIIRASHQWFIDTEKLKHEALECLNSVSLAGVSSIKDLEARIMKRPYWCISRQRLWGAPIPAVYNSTTNEPIISKSLIDHYCSLLEEKGADFWWTVPASELIPERILDELNLSRDEIVKGNDILDIWFDSGISWSSVLENDKVADVYLEGVDQLTGWFQSSLLTSVAVRGKAPYKNIFVHGYAVDENGQKMSKSLGNIVSPTDIVAGGHDLKKQPAYGTDVLRWWVAAHTVFHANINVSHSVLVLSKEDVQRIRLIMKFLLGALNDYSLDRIPKDPQLSTIDKYMLHRLKEFLEQVQKFYTNYQFNHVCQTVNNFIANDVSSFYCHLTKDRLYCDPKDSDSRRACQFIMATIIESLLFSLAPIMPHLTEEIYSHYSVNQGGNSYFSCEHQLESASWCHSEAKEIMDLLLKVKTKLSNVIPAPQKSSEYDIFISAPPKIFEILQNLTHSEMRELLQVAKVNLSEDSALGGFSIKAEPTTNHFCERCRCYSSSASDSLCLRCSQSVQSVE